MKKTTYFITMLFCLAFFINCSKNDDTTTPTLNETGQKLIGQWYFKDPSTNPATNNSFTFSTDGKVIYKYSIPSGTSYDSETGTYSINGDKLTMIYPQTVTLTYIQKMVFATDKKVQFVATGNSNETPYNGTYYKIN